MRVLIVNADDFNLTEGVSNAILHCHDRGVVSSTSVFANLPLSQNQLSGLKKRKKLGTGLHLNVTFGRSLSPENRIKTLLDKSGYFKKKEVFQKSRFSKKELELEFRTQILWFRSTFEKLPDHLNTHHHIHAIPVVLDVVMKLAKEFGIPIRRVIVPERYYQNCSNRTVLNCSFVSDYFFGNLSKDHYWNETSLETILRCLPEGTSEIMCHPGYLDAGLRQISSFTNGRQREFKLFSDSKWKLFLKKEGIILGSL